MSEEKTALLEINDLFNEMKDENNRLLSQLLWAQKCIKVLQSYRNYLIVLSNSGECDKHLEIKSKFNDLEIDYKLIESHKQFINNENSLTITQSLFSRESHKKVVEKDLKTRKKKTIRVKKKSGTVKKEVDPKVVIKSEPNISKTRDILNDYVINNNNNSLKSQSVSRQESKRSQTNDNSVISGVESKAKKIKGIKGYYCDYCDYHNINFNRVESHINKSHLFVRPFNCNKCELSFTGKHLLSGHLKLQHSNTRYYCDYNECKFETINYNSLKEHRLRHIGDKQFKCSWPSCERRFVTKSELIGHHKRVHNDIRSFRCDWPACDSAFKTSQDLKHHMCTHTGQKVHSCEWPGCEWRFTRKPQLDRHMLIHKEVRNFICNWPECEKRFRTSCALKVHLMVHRGERPFGCEWPKCERRFTEKANMLRHLKTHNNHKLKH